MRKSEKPSERTVFAFKEDSDVKCGFICCLPWVPVRINRKEQLYKHLREQICVDDFIDKLRTAKFRSPFIYIHTEFKRLFILMF